MDHNGYEINSVMKTLSPFFEFYYIFPVKIEQDSCCFKWYLPALGLVYTVPDRSLRRFIMFRSKCKQLQSWPGAH